MPSIIAKRKRNKTYYYVATSKRVDGKPRIVQQTYLGTAERIERLLRDRTAPVPLDVTALELGLPGALWLAASSSGAFDALLSLWPAPAKGPSTAHFLLLAAIQRVCCPGPKTKVGAWYERTVLRRLWGFPPEAFTSQAFRDRFDAIRVADPQDPDADEDDLQRAQHALLDAFRQRELVGQRVLAYDSTNFHTWIASDNARNTLAQRGSNKQRRNDLRQVGLSCALDGERGLVLAHRVYPGNVSDSLELPAALQRIGRVLDRAAIPRGDVTLVMDKGTAALANTLELQRAGLGWVSALPWNQAPESLRSAGDDRLQPLGAAHPGVRAAAERLTVHGGEYLCVVKHSASFAAEQLLSAVAALGKATRALQRLAREVSKPNARHTERGLRNRIRKHLAADYVSRLLRCELERDGDRWRLDFALDHEALNRLQTERFGRTTLLTSRLDWSAAQVVAACDGQQHVERVFRDLKGGDMVGWGPMHHWTDTKIQVHAFCCLLGVSLLQHVRRQAEPAWPDLTSERLREELGGLEQYEVAYPPAKAGGAERIVTVASKRTLVQEALAGALGLDRLLERTGVRDGRG